MPPSPISFLVLVPDMHVSYANLLSDRAGRRGHHIRCMASRHLRCIVLLVSCIFSYDFVSADIPLAAGLVSYSVVMPSPLNYTELLGKGTTFDGVVLGPTLVT